MTTKQSKLWIDKYRPKQFEDMYCHEDITFLLSSMQERKSIPNLICYGPSGCGKTTTMLAYAKILFGLQMDFNVMRINASDERGISMIRKKIQNFIQTQSLFGNQNTYPFKMIILDEADYMTNDAQFSMSYLMDDYPNVLFVFICNYVHKLEQVLQTRCQLMHFCRLSHKDIRTILNRIVYSENIQISKEGVDLLCKVSKQDIRTALYMLQSLHYTKNKITPRTIYKYYQYPTLDHMNSIIGFIKEEKIEDCYNYILEMVYIRGVLMKHLMHMVYLQYANMIEDIEVYSKFIIALGEMEETMTYEYTHHMLIGWFVMVLLEIKEYL